MGDTANAIKRLVRKIAKRKQEKTYFRLDKLDATGALYRVAFGKRSKGKTYAILEKAIENYVLDGSALAYIRRYNEDFRGKRAMELWNGILRDDLIRKYTSGEWTDVHYFSGRWYLCRYDEKGSRIDAPQPIVYGFSLTQEEHEKGADYNRCKIICLDEFISRTMYLENEFVRFENLCSTIIRGRDDVIIYMFGNTINRYCPYFEEMGLKHVRQQAVGTIDLYEYGNSGLTVAVEYYESGNETEKANKYFAFDNPKLRMITDGNWEIALYPHLPIAYEPDDVVYRIYLQFAGDTLQGEVIYKEESYFLFFHPWTREITDDDAIVYSTEHSAKPNYRRRITRPRTEIERKIAEFFIRDKVFYATNEVGEIVRNYLLFCNSDDLDN